MQASRVLICLKPTAQYWVSLLLPKCNQIWYWWQTICFLHEYQNCLCLYK